MKPNWKLILIIFLAAWIRFYQLGSIPPSLDWDEVSLAYNAQALLETGRDEYGNTWPLTIRSFNDYKPPLYAYSLIPVLAILGKTNLAVRLPAAIAGTLTVLVTYFLVKELFPKSKKFSIFKFQFSVAEVSVLLLAISPWHAHFSRVAFEANLGLLFFIAGMAAFLKSRSFPRWLPIAALSFGLSLLAYHSTKVVVPLLLLLIVWPHLKTFIKARKSFIAAGVIALFFSLLVGRTVQQGIGQARLETVSFKTIDNLLDRSVARVEAENLSAFSRIVNHRYIAYSREIIGGYLDHYTIKFWFIEGDSIPRLTFVGTMGLLYWWTLPFLAVGIFTLVKKKSETRKIVFSWFLVAPAASALTSGTPNAIRSIFFLPIFQIFIALGLVTVISWIRKQKKKLLYALCSMLYALLAAANIILYFHLYYRHAPVETSQGWQYGYQQMVEWVMARKDKYDKVIITTTYDQPYIFVLWYGNYSPRQITNPGEFAKGFDKFEFRLIKWSEDRNLANTLLIESPEEVADDQKVIWQTDFLDNTPAFLADESEG